MVDAVNTARLFETLVAAILASNGFVIHDGQTTAQERYDFLATHVDEIWAIEVKYYRTERAQVSLLESAAARLVRAQYPDSSHNCMLVVSCRVDPALRHGLETTFGITIVDRDSLYSWAAASPALVEQLAALLEGRDPVGGPTTAREQTVSLSRRTRPPSPPREDTMGTQLCQELRALGRGRPAWRAYEAHCERILRYLFPHDLLGWHRQKRTDDGLNRFDSVCRIKPTTDFWNFLLDHLDSRYVLFEFKNYRERIKQGQILTTEKYLLGKALRRVAIVLSRDGADAGAIAMTQGAMREHGKLMLILNDDRVCEMLHMKQRGEDPSDLLFDVADKFLLSLPR
jgi:hypothetical protein